MNEYDEGRIWYRKKGRVAFVGLTEKGMAEIGNVQSMIMPVEGDECLQDDVVGEIEGSAGSFEVIAPLDGTIESVNEGLADDFDVLESDPLDEGWIFKIRVPKTDEDEDDDDE